MPSAFILHHYMDRGESGDRVDRVPEAVKDGELFVGWSRAPELLRAGLSREDFKRILGSCYPEYSGRQASTHAASMWLFIREMHPGDLVVIPEKRKDYFFIAEVTGDAYHDPEKVAEGTAFRRGARWLNGRQPVPKHSASDRLRKALSWRRACMPASELLPDIQAALHAVDGSPGLRQPDIKQRQRVERAAQQAVEDWYYAQGYHVIDVSADNLGWDLEATKDGHTLTIEVKGLSGSTPMAYITPNEYSPIKGRVRSTGSASSPTPWTRLNGSCKSLSSIQPHCAGRTKMATSLPSR